MPFPCVHNPANNWGILVHLHVAAFPRILNGTKLLERMPLFPILHIVCAHVFHSYPISYKSFSLSLPKARSNVPYLANQNESLPPLCFWNMLFILLLYQLAHPALCNIFSWIYVLFSSLNSKFLNERGFFVLTFIPKCVMQNTFI